MLAQAGGLRYLLPLRKTANVKPLIERLFGREDWTRATDASQGWQAIDDALRLSGWSKAGRVVVLRRRIKHDIALTAKKRGRSDNSEQLVLALPHLCMPRRAAVDGPPPNTS